MVFVLHNADCVPGRRLVRPSLGLGESKFVVTLLRCFCLFACRLCGDVTVYLHDICPYSNKVEEFPLFGIGTSRKGIPRHFKKTHRSQPIAATNLCRQKSAPSQSQFGPVVSPNEWGHRRPPRSEEQ